VRLPSFELTNMSVAGVKNWVFQAFQDGASEVYLVIEPILCNGENPRKVLEFISAAKEVKQSLDSK